MISLLTTIFLRPYERASSDDGPKFFNLLRFYTPRIAINLRCIPARLSPNHTRVRFFSPRYY